MVQTLVGSGLLGALRLGSAASGSTTKCTGSGHAFGCHLA